MNSRFTIKIKKRSQPGWLCWLIIVLPFLFGTLNDLLGLPWSIRYVLDLAWFALLLMMIAFRDRLIWNHVKTLVVWTAAFLLYTALAYLVQYQSGLYYLWGVRNTFRMYVAFFSFCIFLTQQDVEQYLDVFDKLFYADVAVSLIQFFALDIDGDYLGGLFGAEMGSNGYTNIFFCIVLTRAVVFYLEKRETLRRCLVKFIAALLVAALAEIKFFFMEAILIILLAVLFTNFSWRKVWIMAGGLTGIFLGASLLVVFFPNSIGFLSLEYFWERATANQGYTSSGDMNRLNAITVINDRFLRNRGAQLFGFGLGNCETSSFSFLNTPFFKKYGDLHYSWISYAFLYLECGWIGLIFYYGFFAILYRKTQKMERNCDAAAKAYCIMTRILLLLCVLISVYNSTLRTEAAYMAYFVLAVPFAIHKP